MSWTELLRLYRQFRESCRVYYRCRACHPDFLDSRRNREALVTLFVGLYRLRGKDWTLEHMARLGRIAERIERRERERYRREASS